MTKKLATCKILLQLVYSFPHGDMLLSLKGERFPNQAFKIKQNPRTVCQFFHDLCPTSGARPYLFSNLTMYLQFLKHIQAFRESGSFHTLFLLVPPLTKLCGGCLSFKIHLKHSFLRKVCPKCPHPPHLAKFLSLPLFS